MVKNSFLPATLGELKEINWQSRSVKEELRENLIKRLENKEKSPLIEGVIGYTNSVEKNIVNALLAKHNFILLGLRGQGKTKIIRALKNFLDEKTPIIKGSLLNEDPFHPITPHSKRLVGTLKEKTPIEWIYREDRFREKLATPDVSISDLIGDIDPIKAAREKLDISDEEVIHWGIIPRSNRGIFAINELPDLQSRIQVGLFNILEENDIQVRGFPLRVPLDILLVFSANPEDYTNRGRIITPLKDRISSEIITHYPTSLSISKEITASQIDFPPNFRIPEIIRDICEEITFLTRTSEQVDKMSGVSQRLSICILESVIANAEQRKIRIGTQEVIFRLMDFYGAISAMTGKMELIEDISPEESIHLAAHFINRAITKIFDKTFPPLRQENKVKDEKDSFLINNDEYEIILEFFKKGNQIKISDDLNDKDYYQELSKIPQLNFLVKKFVKDKKLFPLYMEILLEGLYGNQVINRNIEGNGMKFFNAYSNMFKNF